MCVVVVGGGGGSALVSIRLQRDVDDMEMLFTFDASDVEDAGIDLVVDAPFVTFSFYFFVSFVATQTTAAPTTNCWDCRSSSRLSFIS